MLPSLWGILETVNLRLWGARPFSEAADGLRFEESWRRRSAGGHLYDGGRRPRMIWVQPAGTSICVHPRWTIRHTEEKTPTKSMFAFSVFLEMQSARKSHKNVAVHAHQTRPCLRKRKCLNGHIFDEILARGGTRAVIKEVVR